MVEITDNLLNENFPNDFLVQVAFEIRFPTDLTIKNKVSEFQGLIKEEFYTYEEGFSIPLPIQPNVEISNLLNYKFLNEKKNLELYLNNYTIFGLRTKAYPGYKKFLKIFLESIRNFIEISNINKITRLGIRYINSIPLEKVYEKSNKLKNQYFSSLIAEKYENEFFDSERIDLRYSKEQYEIHQQFIFRKNPNNIYEVIIDLDNSLKDLINVDLNEIEEKLNDLHHLIKIKFFEMITDDFLIQLREKKGDKNKFIKK